MPFMKKFLAAILLSGVCVTFFWATHSSQLAPAKIKPKLNVHRSLPQREESQPAAVSVETSNSSERPFTPIPLQPIDANSELLQNLAARLQTEGGNPEKNKIIMQQALQLVNYDTVLERREAALGILGKALEISPDLLASVTQISRSDANNDVRIRAVAALQSWMTQHPELREQLTEQLVQTFNFSDDSSVRVHVMQTLAAQNQDAPEKVLPVLKSFLGHEPDLPKRLLLATATRDASPEIKDFALSELEAAYAHEKDVTTKRNLISQMVSTGGNNSTHVLQRLSENEPLLALEIKDYVEILESGVKEPNEIFGEKMKRDVRRASHN